MTRDDEVMRLQPDGKECWESSWPDAHIKNRACAVQTHQKHFKRRGESEMRERKVWTESQSEQGQMAELRRIGLTDKARCTYRKERQQQKQPAVSIEILTAQF